MLPLFCSAPAEIYAYTSQKRGLDASVQMRYVRLHLV